MEALAVLRLIVSPRRHSSGQGYLEDDDEIAFSTPYTSAPSSPRRAFAKAEVEEAPLGEVRAAVPFVWELVPGKPKDDVGGGAAELSVLSDHETEDSGRPGLGSSSSPGGSETTESTLSRDSSNTEFEFSSRFVGVVEPLPCRAAEELFSNGQLLPLRLPPRLQAVKNLRNSDSSCSDSLSSSGSFQSYHSPLSPRIAGSPKKSISLCVFTRTAEEMAVLGVQERKLQRPRSLSPLRLFNRESSPPGSNLSSDCVSSASSSSPASSSSSSSETNTDSPQDSPEEENTQGSTLKDHLFSDMATASMRVENSMIAQPRQVQSRRELLKKQQEQWNGFADAEKVDAATPALTPSLSRSNARSRLSIDVQVKSSQKEKVGRAIFANRFGMLCSCMGMVLPESP